VLRPEYQLTRFLARDEMTILTDLCDRTVNGSRTGIAVLAGAGGSGKTRLGLELADRMRRQGWYAGVLAEGLDSTSMEWLAQVTTPLLVVVDYADARIKDVQNLLQILRARLERHPAIILLTARSIEGDWRSEILNREITNGHPVTVESVQLDDHHPLALQVYQATFRGERSRDRAEELTADHPTAFAPNLATALSNQAAIRSEMGDRTGAMAAIDEAVTLTQQLTADNPAAFTPDLAMTLANRANVRSQSRDPAGAMAAIHEAVTLYDQLTAENPNAFTPDFVTALTGQAIMLSQSGDPSSALAAIEEAVALLRVLATANPPAFTPDLATTLTKQANRLFEMGDRAAALAAIEEAVTLCRQLVADNSA
jgi:tetratricopeptide (TPR) repeat protein